MKRNSKRRHPFVVVYLNKDKEGDPYTVFIGMLQSPKCPERYAWFWALKKVRNWLKEKHIPFEFWTRYNIYPVNRFNCSQWDYHPEDRFYDHIHVADEPKEDDEEMIKWYNEIKSKWKPSIK